MIFRDFDREIDALYIGVCKKIVKKFHMYNILLNDKKVTGYLYIWQGEQVFKRTRLKSIILSITGQESTHIYFGKM